MSISKNIKQAVDNVQTDATQILADTTIIKADTTTLKADTTTLKTDTTAIKALHAVPGVDSAANANMRDVIGQKGDSHSGDSIYALLKILEEHIHGSQFMFPFRAPMPQLTSAAGDWAAFPTPTELIPANTITSDFDIHWALILNISANQGYDMELYAGPPGSEVKIAEFGTGRSAAQSAEGSVPIQTSIQPANTRISAALSTSGAAVESLRIKLLGHTY